MGEFCAWHKSFPSSIYARIDSYITAGIKPNYSSNRKNNLNTFNLQFQDKGFIDILDIKTGDDIVITTDATATLVKDRSLAGKINNVAVTIGAMGQIDTNDNCAKQLIYNITIEQRDFSDKPFPLIYLLPVMVSDMLTMIFQEHTRSDLGGLINGVLIPKFIMLCNDVQISDYNFEGIAKDHLIELINTRAGLKWRIISYCEHDTINGLNTCYQVEIYA